MVFWIHGWYFKIRFEPMETVGRLLYMERRLCKKALNLELSQLWRGAASWSLILGFTGPPCVALPRGSTLASATCLHFVLGNGLCCPHRGGARSPLCAAWCHLPMRSSGCVVSGEILFSKSWTLHLKAPRFVIFQFFRPEAWPSHTGFESKCHLGTLSPWRHPRTSPYFLAH